MIKEDKEGVGKEAIVDFLGGRVEIIQACALI